MPIFIETWKSVNVRSSLLGLISKCQKCHKVIEEQIEKILTINQEKYLSKMSSANCKYLINYSRTTISETVCK
uniref:Uncharacterized protein n=1 Tax=Arion vulgaris TaxID=1028688 RepID=A0A0B6ZDT4_9EUPU